MTSQQHHDQNDRQPSYRRPEHPQGDDDRLLTIVEAAELTRLPVGTLRYKRHDHSGPRSFRMGRRVFYWHSDVLAWIDQQYDGDGPRAA